MSCGDSEDKARHICWVYTYVLDVVARGEAGRPRGEDEDPLEFELRRRRGQLLPECPPPFLPSNGHHSSLHLQAFLKSTWFVANNTSNEASPTTLSSLFFVSLPAWLLDRLTAASSEGRLFFFDRSSEESRTQSTTATIILWDGLTLVDLRLLPLLSRDEEE